MAPLGSVRVVLEGSGVAIPRGTIDNFEESESSPAGIYASGETIADYYGGDTGQFTRQQTTVLEAAYSAECDPGDSNAYSIASTSGLNHYPTEGETFRAKLRASQGLETGDPANFVSCGWFSQSETRIPDGYEVLLRGDDTLTAQVRSSGSPTTLASESVTTSNATTYEVEVEITGDQSGTHNIQLYDDANNTIGNGISFQDTSYSSGGFQWLQNASTTGNTTGYWDHGRVI